MGDFESAPSQLVDIPGGGITLRDDRLKRAWKVVIPPFRISKYPVTQMQYASIAGAEAIPRSG